MTTMVSTEQLVTAGAADRPRVRRRAMSTRRGPIAVPVAGSRRPGGVPAPSLAPSSRVHQAQVRARTTAGPEADTWEWTDRGLAVIMGLGLMVVLAALAAIITVTWQVTSLPM